MTQIICLQINILNKCSQASFSTSNLDELWTAFKEVIISTSDNHRSHNPSQRFSRSLAHIQDFLNLQPRNMPQFQAELHLKVNNIMERMLIINKDSLKSLGKGIVTFHELEIDFKIIH